MTASFSLHASLPCVLPPPGWLGTGSFMAQGTLQLPSCQLQLGSAGEKHPSTSIYSRENWHPKGSREQQVGFGFAALLSDGFALS